MLEGVLTRGTAQSLRHLASYAGGKTGTSDNENDAWFVSFTKDVTVAVWVGYDNLSGRRTLGDGGTGGRVAAPIAESIIQASWLHYAPKTPLPHPSADIQHQVKAVPVGRREDGGYTEYYRLDSSGNATETKYLLVGRHRADDDEPSGSVVRTRRKAQRPPPSVRPQPQPYGWGFYGLPFDGNTRSLLRKEEDRY
jgi:membrane carboxypeptidase/penicillin-binding protein